MLRIGKGTEIRSMSTLPSGLKGDDALILMHYSRAGQRGPGLPVARWTFIERCD